MLNPLNKPTFLILGGFFIAFLQGCSSLPLQSDQLLNNPPPEFARAQELTSVSFNSQRDYECGPASLATVLQWQGSSISDQELVPEIYIPQRKGSLQIELLSATRRHGYIPYLIDKNMSALLREVKAGHPVLVLQNLGLDWSPQWHYAVVIGYDINKDQIILRSGDIKRRVNSFSLFENTWRRAKYWGFIALPTNKLPASDNAFAYLKSVAPFEKLNKVDFALRAYETALKRWPNDRNLLMATGNASYAMNKRKSSEKYYRKVIAKNPNDSPALNNLAQVLYEQKKFKDAEKFIHRAIDKNDKYKKEYTELLLNIRAAIKNK